MTLKGIDISSWQSDINLAKVLTEIDFCIVKATQGINYVNPHCDNHVQGVIRAKKLFGYYHFADAGNALKEAEYFWNNTLGYTGRGIPVLDFEVWSSTSTPVQWCEKFLERYYELSHVWPVLYISASHCIDFRNSWIPKMCGLWVAGYPRDYSNWPSLADLPYDVSPWEFTAIWQFASDWILKGYSGNLDANLAFMDANAWLMYAKPEKVMSQSKPESKRKSCEELADEVLAGKWGSSWNRQQALDGAYGPGTYDHVQSIINERMI